MNTVIEYNIPIALYVGTQLMARIYKISIIKQVKQVCMFREEFSTSQRLNLMHWKYLQNYQDKNV